MPLVLTYGNRVSVLAPSLEHQQQFLANVSKSSMLHKPWASPPATPEAFAAYIEKISRSDHAGFFLFARERLAGVVNINNIVMSALCSGYLGYYAFSGSERRGVMTEGLRLVVAYAFDNLGLHRVEANIQPENTASIALVRRLGFTREGFSRRYLKIGDEWRDHERWALIAEDASNP